MNKCLIYTFYNRWALTCRLAWKFRELNDPQIEVFYINNKNSLNLLIEKIKTGQYELIIGLGDFRKNSKKIFINKKFINKYGKKIIDLQGEEFLHSQYNSIEKDFTQITESTSNGPCNRSGYIALKTIKDFGVNSNYTFLHIPKSFDFEKAADYLEEIIRCPTHS